jgi:hypothetical protein
MPKVKSPETSLHSRLTTLRERTARLAVSPRLRSCPASMAALSRSAWVMGATPGARVWVWYKQGSGKWRGVTCINRSLSSGESVPTPTLHHRLRARDASGLAG